MKKFLQKGIFLIKINLMFQIVNFSLNVAYIINNYFIL